MEQRRISGEEYRRIQSEAQPQRKNSHVTATIAGAVVVVALLGVSIYGGIVYQKHNQAAQPTNTPAQGSTNSNNNNSGVSNGSGSGSSNGNSRTTGAGSTTGTVTAISATSITVQPSDGGSVQTLAITSSTSVSNTRTQSFGNPSSGQGNYTDVHIGDKVLVTPDASNPDQAIGILLNPQ